MDFDDHAYLSAGDMLVKAMNDIAEVDSTFYLRITERGRRKPVARRCLDFFAFQANGTARA